MTETNCGGGVVPQRGAVPHTLNIEEAAPLKNVPSIWLNSGRYGPPKGEVVAGCERASSLPVGRFRNVPSCFSALVMKIGGKGPGVAYFTSASLPSRLGLKVNGRSTQGPDNTSTTQLLGSLEKRPVLPWVVALAALAMPSLPTPML